MADQLEVSQVVGQIEYDAVGELKVSQVVGQIEYIDPADIQKNTQVFIITS